MVNEFTIMPLFILVYIGVAMISNGIQMMFELLQNRGDKNETDI